MGGSMLPSAFAPTTPCRLPRRPLRRARVCVCAARSPEGGRGGNGKRDPIAEWVARARADGRDAAENDVPADLPPTPKARADRRGAASALDAVDRLFGGTAGPPAMGGVHASMQPSTVSDRERWFDSVRDGEQREEDDDSPVDVSAFPTSSRRASAKQQRRRRAVSWGTSETDGDDGFEEANIDESNSDVPEVPKAGRGASARAARRGRSGVSGGVGKSSSEKGGGSTKGSRSADESFSRLLDIARRGGSGAATRAKKPDFEPRSAALGDVERVQPTSSQSNAQRRSGRSGRGVMGVGRLIDLTRRARDGDDGMFDDEEDEVEERRPRQRYIATRRIGGRERHIRDAPAEWAPMSGAEIGRLRSESAPLDAGRPLGADPVRDCRECYGTGLEMCTVCTGAGWVDPPLNGDMRPLVKRLWERPNLVIDRDGTAQCPYCVGMGKRLCACCEGSGSALRKGFDPADKYKVFDMFQGGIEGGDLYDEDVKFEYDDEEWEETEEKGEEEEYAIYTGEASGFELSLPSLETSAIERETDADVIELGQDEQQPFQNGFYEEDVDFGRPPQRAPIMKRVELTRKKSKRVVTTVLDDEDDEDESEEEGEEVADEALEVRALREDEGEDLDEEGLEDDDLGGDEIENVEQGLELVDGLEEEDDEIMDGVDDLEDEEEDDELDDPLYEDDDDEEEEEELDDNGERTEDGRLVDIERNVLY